jgi:hypothetical protein
LSPEPAVEAFRERRKYERFILRVGLRLRGTKVDGNKLDETVATSVVSAGGFACNCLTFLTEGTLVEVFLLAKNEQSLGSARVVRAERISDLWFNCSFALEEPRHDWFLIRE